MAINKRRVLDNARKHAQRGAKQRALKEYNKLISADPRDSKLLLEIGDAYRRWGQPDEAVSQYSKVADQYKQEGFDARAVAVLKQILTLDPKRYSAHVNLADLYARMGLASEAVSSLRTAADGYYREGRRTESLELLRKMATLDPSNTASRLKVADLLHQEGLEDEAISEFKAVAEELRRQEAHDELDAVYGRILEIRPGDVESLSARARDLMDLARFEEAEPFAIRALEGQREPENFELLIGVYKGLGQEAREAEVTRGLASLYRDRGDEESSREVLQRLSPEVMMEASSFRLDRSEVVPSEVDEGDLLPDEPFHVLEASEASDWTSPEVSEPEASESEASEGSTLKQEASDPSEDWMAEASVYLRYGKPAEAIEVLQKVLEVSSENREALERLGEAYVDNEQRAEAIDCWREALALSRCQQDQVAFDALYRRMIELDPDLADTIEPMASLENSSAALSLDPASLSSVGASGEAATLSSSSGSEQSFSNLEVEVDLADATGFSVGSALSESSASSSPDRSTHESDSSRADESCEDSAGVSQSRGETASGIREDLEEAAFYLEQGLDTEAEEVYQRILEQAPNHPTALLKLGEVVSRRGGDPSAFVSSTPEREGDSALGLGTVDDICPDDQTEMQDVEDLFGDQGIEIDLEVEDVESHVSDAGEESEVIDPEGSPAGSISVERPQSGDDEDGGWRAPELADDLAAVLAEAEAAIEATAATEFGSDGDVSAIDLTELEEQAGEALDAVSSARLADSATEESESTVVELSDLVDENALFEPQPVEESIPSLEPAQEEVLEAPELNASLEADFDLAAELADVFEEANRAPVDPNEESQSGSTLIDGFESVFADFKKGVSTQVASTDFDTHFDLAIAYREMALWDDAMAQFKICLASTERRVESLHMMALCALELGQPHEGVTYLEQALAGGEQSADRWAALYFDLGRAQRGAGDFKAARRSFETVAGLDPQFPGLSEQRQCLASDHPEVVEEPVGTLESFDDLVAEITGSQESVSPPPSGGGADAADLASPLSVQPITEAVPDRAGSEDAVPARPPRAGGIRKRKKISFV